MMKESLIGLGLFCVIFITTVTVVLGSKNYEKVKLANVQVLTLRANKMTTGRRGAPVSQLSCISNCQCILPHTVQCVNQGWDGSSIQWECKADLETGYKFGDLSVTCEGYDYADDEYILAGSCGLEYSLISDKSSGKQGYGWNKDILGKSQKSGLGMQDMIALGACALIMYALYKTCIARSINRNTQESPTDGDVPPDDRQYPNMGWNIPGMGGNIPGMGRNQGFTGPTSGASCGAAGMGGNAGRGGAGGFWTGLATGGLMGYMFGNRGGGYQQQRYYDAPRNRNPGFFGRSEPSFSSSSSSFASTQPSTGFASTRRR